MEIKSQILSHYDRDSRLHKLYSNKELLVFMKGIVWFEQQITEIWLAYYY
jgi:hypothetical protein